MIKRDDVDRDKFATEDDDFEPARVDPFRASASRRVVHNVFAMLGTLRDWILRPFSIAFDALAACFGYLQWQLAKLSDRIRDVLLRGWWRLLELLRVDGILRAVDSVTDTASRSVVEVTMAVEERTVGALWLRSLAERVGGLRSRVAVGWYDLLDRASQSRVLRVLVVPLRALTRMLGDLTDFLIGWLWTREYRHLLFGIPGFLLMIPLAYCAVRLPFHTPEAKAKHYRLAADTAMQDEDIDSAQLYFRKLAQLGHVHEHVTFRGALFAASQDDWPEAYHKMQQIAPVSDEPGMPEAHLWIANTIANGDIEQDNPDSAVLVEKHLRRAIAKWPGPAASLQLWLADLCRQGGRHAEALDLLDDIVPRDLDLRGQVKMSEQYLVLGRTQQSRRGARSIRTYYAAKEGRNETLTATDFLVWSASAELLGDIVRSSDLILQGLEQYPEDESLRAIVPLICATRYDLLPRSNAADQARMELLQTMIEFGSDPEPALTRAALLLNEPHASAPAQAMIQAHDGPLPARTLQALGDMSMLRDDRVGARRYYSEAVDRDPENHVAVNNLAYLTAHQEPRDLDMALDLAQRAVEIVPNNPHYLETRGQIFLLHERWDEAVKDLSLALNGLSKNQREIHQSLALAFNQLGLREQARFHEARATQ